MGIDEEQQASGLLEWLGKKAARPILYCEETTLDLEATLGKSDNLRFAKALSGTI